MRIPLLSSFLLALAAATVHAPPGHAQFGTSRASFTAPTAATLGRFGEVPVALYTGQPDISIPLFTAEGRELKLPVTLRYQGGGVRVDEVGGWAGMGWALETGGAITRTVRGIPDDHPNGYWNTGNTFYSATNWPNPNSPASLFSNMQGGYIDGEPDQWFFNFAGRSGQFVAGPTSASSTLREVRTTPYQKLRFEPSNNFKTWTVTTEDGTQYVFAAADTTLDQSGTVQPSGSEYVTPTVSPDFISSWHLTEVRSPGGDAIQLYYTSYQAHHEMTNGASRFDILMSKPSWSGATCPTTTSYRHIAGHQIKAKRLDSIRSATHTIRFIPDATLRADALGLAGARQEPRLAQIEVRTPTGTVLRRYVFDHDYFGGNRLRLKNVFEQDAAGTSLPPWSFEYDAQDFPARNSFSQDHGGYWNGKTNASLVPAQSTSYALSDGTHYANLPGADREPDLARARVGTLSRLTYPTGGSTSFVWELHEYGTTRTGTVTRDSAGAPQSASASNITYQPNRTTTTTFTIGGAEPALVNLEVVQQCTLGMPSCAWAKITGPGIDQTYTASTTVSRTLSPGTYTLTATSPTDTRMSYATITVTWQEVVEIVGRKPGAGLRIAEVRTTDGHGPDQVRKYRYRLQSDTTRSSGLLPFEPTYGEWIHGDGCDYFSRTASSNLPLGAAAPITYREVTVLHGENGEFGRTRETFRNVYDNPDFAPPVPAPNLRLTSWEGRQGQRLTSTVSNAAGQVQQHTKSLYSFRMDEPTTFRRFRGLSLSRFVSNQYILTYSYRAFEVVSEWSHLATDSVFTYDEAGNASVWSARSYTHGNPAHIQPTQLDEASSDGGRRITRMRYPADYADGVLTSDPEGLSDGQAEAHALTMMKGTAHIHSPVVERWVSDVSGGTERVLQSELTTYLSWPTVAGRSYLPSGRLIFNAPGPVTDFVPATVTSAAFAWENRYQVNEQVSGYDSWGRVRELTDANNAIHTYTYGGNANNAFLTQISRHPAGGSTTLTTTVGYDASGQMSSLLDEGGSLRTFTYDGLGRLRQIRGSGGTVLQGFAYTYSRTPGNGWVYQPATPNAVTDTTYQRHTPTVAGIVSTGYFDGVGRPIQTVQQDGATWHVAARQYDASDRAWRLWKRYPRTTAGFDPGFAANATAFYNSDLGVSNAQPYADSLFTPDPLRRPKSIVPEYVGTSPTATRTFAYGVETGTGRRYTEITDEAGKKRRMYSDGFGNEVRTVLGYGATEASTAQLGYNALGQRTQLTDPRGIITQYTRNTRGLVTTRTNPDGGNRSHKYDRAGNLRYTQDANQAAAGQVLFTTFDFAGRPLVSGVGAATFATLDPQAGSAGLETTTSNWREVRHYDGKPSTTVFPWSLFATQLAPLTLGNVNGRLAAQASTSNGAWQADFYSYDTDGKIAARHTFTQANGGSGVLAAVNTSLGYTRDLTGAVTQRTVNVGGTTFYQWYDYNARGQLSQVYASTSATKPATADAAYTYRSSGRVGQRQFQGGPLVPLRYTIREQMERLGDPASTAYPFSARYSYHSNGQLQEQEFYSAGSPAASKRYGWVFNAGSWDALNRLRGADYSAWTGTGWNTTTAHDLSGIVYDAAGNITGLGRYNQAGTAIDNLAYGYGSGSNRLSSTTDNAGVTAETWDAETGAFTYDANGNVKTAPAPYSITAATYDHRNLPLSHTAAGVVSTYRYNGEGQRITRQVGAGGTDVYLKEGPATLGVVTVAAAGTATAWHFNLLAGEQVIGRVPNTGNRRYYHRDMLGSTRAVVEGATVVESYDYDPWGLLMPGRTLAGSTREGFTGKEQDAATGLHYFGARYYMAALGRWANVDPPADSFPSWSPYNYVFNDAVGTTDPSGLAPDPCKASDDWKGCPIDLGQGYRGRLDRPKPGEAVDKYEIHIYRVGRGTVGREVAIWGRDGWLNRHHLTELDRQGIPRAVVERVNGISVDRLRRAGLVGPGTDHPVVARGAYSPRVAGILSGLNAFGNVLDIVNIIQAHQEAELLGVSVWWYMTKQMQGFSEREIQIMAMRCDGCPA